MKAMHIPESTQVDAGLEVVDLAGDSAFQARPLRAREISSQMAAMERVAKTFAQTPETILQQLVEVAVQLCGADTAGISLERENGTEAEFYHWKAMAGTYSSFLNALLPRHPSACTICLARGGPQHFRVHRRFFEILGLEAPLVSDGLLLPWEVDGTRGTIFIIAHSRTEAFDREDARLMQLFANFAAIGFRQQRQQSRLIQQARAAAAAEMAHDLAHRINNPLQSLTNLIYLAAQGYHGSEARLLGMQASDDLERLSSLVRQLLALPFQPGS